MLKGTIKSINPKNLQVTIMGPNKKKNNDHPIKIRLEKKFFFKNLCCKNFEDNEIESLKYKLYNDFRKKFVGKKVEFLEYPGNKSDQVDMILNGKNIILEYVEKGWLRIESKVYSKSEYYSKFEELTKIAEKNTRGIYSKDLKFNLFLKENNPNNFIKKNVTGYIKELNHGMIFKVFLNECNKDIIVKFKYIKIPIVNKENVEKLKLCFSQNVFYRDFSFTLLDKENEIYNILIVENDFNPIRIMLESGFARINKEDIKKEDNKSYISMLRKYELKIKNQVNEDKIKNTTLVSAKVVEIHSGNSLTIKLKDGELKRVHIASIKCKNLKSEEPGAFEAKEFLRKFLIGKDVQVDFEYENEFQKDEKEKLVFENVTLFLKGENVSHRILEKGLGMITYSKEKDKMSKYINTYEESLEVAKKSKLGIFDEGLKKLRYWDYSDPNNKKKMLQQVTMNTFENNSKAVVEHIISSEKIKIRNDKEKMYFNIKLNGIKGAHSDPNNELLSEFSKKSIQFLREILLQRDVEFKVYNIDKFGVVHANIFIGKGNVVQALLENGFAYLDRRRPNIPENLVEIEKQAKSKSLNLWGHNFEFLQTNDDTVKESKDKDRLIEVDITECISPELIFINNKNKNQMDKIKNIIKSNEFDLKNLNEPLKSNTLCLVKFNNDYNRGKILKKADAKGLYSIKLIDYGNKSSFPIDKIKSIPNDLMKIPNQAENIQFAFINCLKKNNYLMNDLMDLIDNYIGYSCFIQVKFVKNNLKHVLFFNDEKQTELKDSLNYKIIENGLGYLIDETKESDPEWNDAVEAGYEKNPDVFEERDYN